MISNFDVLDTIIGFSIDQHINSYAELCLYCRSNRMDWFKYVVVYHDFFYLFFQDFWGHYLACSVELDVPYEDSNGSVELDVPYEDSND